MKRVSISLPLLLLTLGLVLAGCGGGSDAVPAGAVAVVNGTEVPRSDLDELIAQAKASYKAQDRDFPRVGTPEYQGFQQQLVARLVQTVQLEQEAEKLDITVSEADVQKARADLVKSRGGDEKKLAAELEEQGVTEVFLLESLRVSVLAQKLFEVVTKDVKVTEQDVLAAYTQSPEQYGGKPETREVRHILIAEKGANGQVDFAKSKAEADRLYAELQGGADFAALAKEFSADEGTKNDGGKYSAVRGASVPEFDKAAYELDTNEISQPVRTTFGYHLIQPLAESTPATSLDKLRPAIKSALLQDKRNETSTTWVEDLQKRYDGKISYAAGLAPPEIPDAGAPTETE